MDLNDRYGTVLNPATPLHACCAGVSTVWCVALHMHLAHRVGE
jgi:hypothetical protein